MKQAAAREAVALKVVGNGVGLPFVSTEGREEARREVTPGPCGMLPSWEPVGVGGSWRVAGAGLMLHTQQGKI